MPRKDTAKEAAERIFNLRGEGGGAPCWLNATPIPMSGKFLAISKARLGTSPSLHLPPINVLVSDDPQRRSNLVAGFVLRCFQRLSDPDLDTRQCPWRDNRYTSGLSNTVLSY